jgi:hypothetical protein
VIFLFQKYFAQSLGSWNILNLNIGINKNIHFNTEAQIRSLSFYNNFHYYEYKLSFTYHLENINLGIGGGRYETYNIGGDFVKPKLSSELRIWPQLNLYSYLGRFKIEHRYRSEFRFTNNGFKSRYRYRLFTNINLNSKSKLNLSSELFISDNIPYFQRVRFNLIYCFEINHYIELKSGIIHQQDYRTNDEIGKTFFCMGFYFKLKNLMTKIQNSNFEINDN